MLIEVKFHNNLMTHFPATIQIAPVTNMQLYPMLPTYGIARAIPEIHAPGIAAKRWRQP